MALYWRLVARCNLRWGVVFLYRKLISWRDLGWHVVLLHQLVSLWFVRDCNALDHSNTLEYSASGLHHSAFHHELLNCLRVSLPLKRPLIDTQCGHDLAECDVRLVVKVKPAGEALLDEQSLVGLDLGGEFLDAGRIQVSTGRWVDYESRQPVDC